MWIASICGKCTGSFILEADAMSDEIAANVLQYARRWTGPLDFVVRGEQLGDARFSEAQDICQPVVDFSRRLVETPDLASLPPQLLEEVINAYGRLDHETSQMRTVRLDQLLDGRGPLSDRRQHYLAQLTSSVETFRRSVLPVLAALRKPSPEYTSARTLSEEIGSLRAQLAEQETVQRALLERSLRAAAQTAVEDEAKEYSSLADQHARRARNWAVILSGIGAVFALTALVQLSSLHVIEIKRLELDWVTVLSAAAPRVLWFGLLGFGVSLCARQYSAEMHNAAVNRQRATALDAVKLLLASVGQDSAARAAVVVRATEIILTSQHTGYTEALPKEQPATDLFRLFSSLRAPQ
jgi:hypothetical protein